MLTAEQILASQKANVETLFGLTSKAFEGVEKLVELNLTATKAALAEAAGTTQAALGVKDAQELLALQASLFQPLAEKTAAYSRHLYDIAASTNAGEGIATIATDVVGHGFGPASTWSFTRGGQCARVGNAKNNDPSLIEPIAVNELA